MSPKQPAKAVAQWRGDASVWLDHATLTEADLEWLAPAKRVTFWAVKTPDRFLADLPHLWWLDVRGGSGTSADFVRGCRGLRYLELNQIRGLRDLSAISESTSLEYLILYGLRQVTELPSLAGLQHLARIELGSMKGLPTIAPVLEAPALRELVLMKAVGMHASDPLRIRDLARLEAFEWFAEDVPNRVWEPVVETVAKPRPKTIRAEDWFAQQDEA